MAARYESVWSTLDEFFNSKYVNIDKLYDFAVQKIELQEYSWMTIADDIYQKVVPLPSGVGIGTIIPNDELSAFSDQLENAYKQDRIDNRMETCNVCSEAGCYTCHLCNKFVCDDCVKLLVKNL